MSSALHSRCWNHDSREAVCRCPQCGHTFCRECVTEHQARLLCARCLEELARTREAARIPRRMTGVWMALAGFLLAWIFFYGTGQALILITARVEQTAWQNR